MPVLRTFNFGQHDQPFVLGESFTRDHIHEIVGGEKVSHLPQKDEDRRWMLLNTRQPRVSVAENQHKTLVRQKCLT